MKRKRNYKRLGRQELTPEVDALLDQHIEIAEKELEKEESRVNMRWNTEQLDVVREAAKSMGITYQTYIKHVVLRQARQDLKEANELQFLRALGAQNTMLGILSAVDPEKLKIELGADEKRVSDLATSD